MAVVANGKPGAKRNLERMGLVASAIYEDLGLIEGDPRVRSILEDAGCDESFIASEPYARVNADTWLWELRKHGRPAFLKRLQRDFGVDRLALRQAIANALAKAGREGKV